MLNYIQIQNSYFSKHISKYYCFFCCTLDQINAGLVSRREKHLIRFFLKNITVQKLLTGIIIYNILQ